MKKFIYVFLASAAMIIFAGEANAQMGKRLYVNGGWQFNGSIANDYVQNGQGYGAYIEGGYYVTPLVAIGGFASFGTNNEYVSKQTYQLKDNAAITTDLDRSLYQVNTLSAAFSKTSSFLGLGFRGLLSRVRMMAARQSAEPTAEISTPARMLLRSIKQTSAAPNSTTQTHIKIKPSL